MGYVGAGFVVNQANTTDGGAINTVAYASTGASAGQYVGGAYAVNLYTGPYGTLSLDFINNYYAIVGVSKTFSQAITFSRASNATRFAPNGVLQYAPHNLLLQSQTFDNASWAAINTTVTANSTTAPDGTSTADTLTGNGVSGAHVIQNGLGISFLAATYTLSVFAKADTNNFIQLRFFSGLGGAFANFNLATGAVGTSGAGATASIQNVGSGWYRCIMTATTTASASGGFNFWLVTSDSAVSGETNSLSTSVFLWGAQLALGPYPLDYTPTTTAVVYGPRFDYNPTTLAPLGLLIEEQRTNLLLQSQDFATTWSVSGTNATVTANTTVAPDGTTTADTLTEDLATGIHACFQGALTTSGVVTLSVFAKLGSGTRFLTIAVNRDTTHNGSATFDLSLGTNTQTQANGGIYASPSATITAAAQGFYRCTFTVTTDTVVQVRIGLNNTGTPTTNNRGLGAGYTGNGTSSLIIWGAQLEAGAFATSYIPTVASTVTRSADVASINTLSPWYNAAAGALFAEYARYANVAGRIATISNNTANNQIRLNCSVAAAIRPDWQIIDATVVQANVLAVNTIAPNVFAKSAGAYAVNSFNQATNAVLGVEDTSGTVPSVSQLNIGANEAGGSIINGHIRRIAYYPRRLTNAELQALTS